MWCVEYRTTHQTSQLPTNNAIQKSSAKPHVSKASAEIWHRRTAHMYGERLQKLAEMVDGVEISGSIEEGNPKENPELCEVCMLTKSKRQISRRPQGRTFGPLGRIHFDLIQITEGYNGHKWMTHFYVEGIRLHVAYTHASKNGCQRAVMEFIAMANSWWNLALRVFHYDHERSAGTVVENVIRGNGILVSHSVVGTPEQNGFGERSGGIIILRGRALIVDAKLPKNLWPEALPAAVYIINRTPTYLDGEKRWIIPWVEAMRLANGTTPKLNLSNLRLYGCKVYARIHDHKLANSDKMAPRAEVGYLVGFVASNIWRIWFPHRNKVESVRDAIFDETKGYDGRPQQIEAIPKAIELGEGQPAPAVILESESDEAILQENNLTNLTLHLTEPRPPQPLIEKTPEPAGFQAESQLMTPISVRRPDGQGVPPGAFPDDDVPDGDIPDNDGALASEGVESTSTIDQASDQAYDQASESEQQLQMELQASPGADSDPDADEDPDTTHQLDPVNADVDTANILTGSRKRKAREDPDFASYHVSIVEPAAVRNAFATALYAPRTQERSHRDDLPPEPRTWKEVLKHPHRNDFLAAARKELDTIQKKGAFQVIQKPNDSSKQIIPLTWVFTYKFDADGLLDKFKARICVRGDLQNISPDEKRAATLAAKTARAIFAISAAFGLRLRQKDAVTAFLNSPINGEVYTQMPEGFREPGQCWKLLRALYGLKISPRLWQLEATKVFEKLGLQPIPEDPCLFITRGIIVFFYVDDIIIASHPDHEDQADQLERDLAQHWELRDLGDARWFLNIRIVRNLQEKKLWLCQDSYIAAMAARYHLTDRRPIATPLPVGDLLPFDGKATPESIHFYQEKVGSAQYATTITRPDAARATAKLSEFLTNPGPRHHEAIDRVIVYLYHTRFLALQYGGRDAKHAIGIFSDASYGDNPDRKSSQGLLYQIYGGPVDWKATKQRTITTSTTEAELLALSETAKTTLWWKRLLNGIGFDDEGITTIRCDNAQTVDLVTKDGRQAYTKLRHVDIRRAWSKQEIDAGNIKVKWTTTASMAADGLTKALPGQKHQAFVEMLGMTDIRHIIQERE
jgi:hypothetical protein